ncbi:MAG: hypothetical protein WA869_22240, partial [Alloacidobacterium sp.]
MPLQALKALSVVRKLLGDGDISLEPVEFATQQTVSEPHSTNVSGSRVEGKKRTEAEAIFML